MADAKAPAKPYGDVKYADPKNGKYPIDTESHIRAAWAYINMPKNASQYPMNGVTLSEVKGRIKAAMDKLGADVSSDSNSGGRSAALLGEPERRYTPGAIECRAAPGGQGERIGGYGAVFGKLSRNLGGFVEQVGTGAFNQSRSLGWPEVICRYNHDANMVLGTTAAADAAAADRQCRPGLRGDCRRRPAPTSWNWCERRDIQFSSFAFRVPPGGDEWSVTGPELPDADPARGAAGGRGPGPRPGVPGRDRRGCGRWPRRWRSTSTRSRTWPRRTSCAGSSSAPTTGARHRRRCRRSPVAAAMMKLMEKRRDPFADQG